MSRQNKMAAVGVKWRTRCIPAFLIWSLLASYVNGYDESYTISQLSPKSALDERLPADVVLQTSQTENIEFSVDPVQKFNNPEDVEVEEEDTRHVIVERSANPNDRLSRSINIEEIPTSNNNEIDNDLELHNKRKYYEIHPTKTIDHLTDRDDEEMMMISSEGFGDRINFRFPGEANRVPKARALMPLGPIIRPTAVQPIFATVTPREQGRQNTEIQNIITGIVKLLNGNVNVQANSQLLNGRPGRPMASRINNRGPPRISDLPPLPDFDKPITPPTHAFHPTKTPPPYPFDRPPHIGVNLPEQIVPPMNSHRPGFHRPMPPWQRPRPRPPVRRPPSLPYKPTLPPMPLDLPDFEDGKPEEEEVVSENETSHSENNIHHDDTNKDTVTILNLPDIFGTADEKEEDKLTTVPETTVTTTTEGTTSTTSTTTEQTTTSTSTTTTTTTTEQPTETTPETTTTTTTTTTTEKPKTEKPVKIEKEKKKETAVEKEKEKERDRIKDKQKVEETKEKIENTIQKIVEQPKETTENTPKNDKTTEKIEPSSIEPSMTEDSSSSVSIATPTPTEGLFNHFIIETETTTTEFVKPSSINSQPLPTSQGIPYHPYRPRPGIVLDDPDFKPHGSRHHIDPSRHRPVEPSVITAAETRPPGYGEIFDVTVSAIQGPGEKGSVHIETVHPLSGHRDHDDIIVSASGDQGFVSIDGKRTYLNLFDTSTPAVGVAPTRVQSPAQHTTPPPTLGTSSSGTSIGTSIGTGVAIPADDIQRPPQRPSFHQHPLHRPAAHQSFSRPHPTVRIDTCIVGDDSTCDLAQNEKCRTEAGISSCQCRPGYARRTHRDPCRRVAGLVLNLRVDRLYDRKVAWDAKLADKESEPYHHLSYEAIRAIDSAFSMTPFSDDFVSGSVNSVHQGEEGNQVFVNYTILMQETAETLRPQVATDIQKHILGVIRRRSNNVGDSALWVDSPAGSVLPVVDLDECASSDLNDCHKLASCTNTWGGFKCQCPEYTLDTGTSGRSCRSCSSAHCNERGQCRYTNSQPTCSCNSGYWGGQCEVDGSVVGVAVGASLAAALVIALTLLALVSWSRKWSREQKAAGMGSPVFSYMAANTIKTPPVGGPPYQVTLEERMRWAQIAEAMAQANHYAQVEGAHTMATRPSSAMFGGYPTLPPVPMPRMGLHGGIQNGTLNTVTSRANTAASHHNMYGYTNHMATESTSSEASSHAQDRADLLVPRPKSRARSMHNQTGIYYDVDYENAPEAIYGTKGIPLSTYTVSRGPPFYRS